MQKHQECNRIDPIRRKKDAEPYAVKTDSTSRGIFPAYFLKFG